ncbi:BASS family bile acid:Na+ symporter [Stackebrandtia albiflava]|uniref:BASS family bile acid:Na+ symporter n=1 Tax=Stackebrandtia albiflava TaxID=406432 RepID=A0A562VBZ6_9ACTN|nr:bile acid:sodium symporter family protein [Stackebrandtia albiflava]TWJ15331.1 BASS family bile acid:Na+ symporter [Stackebrandtia albiflava]
MDSVLTTVMLPVALGVVMLGLGLGLTVADFRRVLIYPKAVLVALACQIVVLPLVCFGIVLAFDLPTPLAVGMMLLAASPGGTTANLYSHLFGGNVALNISLTAVNSVLAVVTLPLVVNLSLGYFTGGGEQVGLQFDKVLQVFAIVLLPVLGGMLVRRYRPGFADRMDRPVRALSVVVLVAVIAGAVISDIDHVAEYFLAVGLAALAFNVCSLAVGYLVPRLFRVAPAEAGAAAFEIGVHNATLAIAVALSPSLLNDAEMAVPAAVYGLLMFFTAAAFGLLLRRVRSREAGEPERTVTEPA